MSRRRAIFTQADVARAVRAAKQTGAVGVDILPDGTITIRLDGQSTPIVDTPKSDGREIII